MEHSEDDLDSKTQYFSTTEYSGGDMYAYNIPKPPEPVVEHKRPVLITIFCVLGFFAVIAGAILGLTETAREVGEWYPPFLWLGAVVHTVAYIGLWRMKGWAPILMLVMFLATQGVLYGMNKWTPTSLGNGVIVAITLMYMKKMD